MLYLIVSAASKQGAGWHARSRTQACPCPCRHPSHSPVVQADVSTVRPAARVVWPHTSVHLRAPFPTKPCGRLYPALVDFFDLTWNRDARDCQGLLTHDGQQTPFQIFRPSKPFWNLDAPCQEESRIEEAVLQNPPHFYSDSL